MKKNLWLSISLLLLGVVIGFNIAKDNQTNTIENNTEQQVVEIAQNPEDNEPTEKSEINTQQPIQQPQKPECITKIKDLCIISTIHLAEGLPCRDYAAEININPKDCTYNGTNQAMAPQDTNSKKDNENMSDRWVGGMVSCKRMGGHMPNEAEMDKLISAFYNGCKGYSRCNSELTNVELAKKLNAQPNEFGKYGFSLWMSERGVGGSNAVFFRPYFPGPNKDYAIRYRWVGTLCIADYN